MCRRPGESLTPDDVCFSATPSRAVSILWLRSHQQLPAVPRLSLRACAGYAGLTEEAILSDVSPEGSGHAETARFRLWTSAELDEADLPLEFEIEGLLAACEPALVAGIGKTLKTSLQADAAISLGLGVPFLGRFPARRKRVGFFSGESGLRTLKSIGRRIAGSKGCRLKDADVFWCSDLPKLGDAEDERVFERLIQDNGLELVCVDPAYLACQLGADANNLFEVGGKLRGLTRIAVQLGCTTQLTHHLRKGTPIGEVPELSAIAWGGFSEWARQWWLLNRRRPYAHDGKHELWLSVGGSAGHGGLWGINVDEGSPEDRTWNVEVLDPEEAKQSVQTKDSQSRKVARDAARQQTVERNLDRLLNDLSNHPDGDTKTAIGTRLGLGTGAFEAAKNLGLSRGVVLSCTVVKQNGSFAGFQAAN